MFAHAKKVRYREDGWQLVRLNPSPEEMLQELGLIPDRRKLQRRSLGAPRRVKASRPARNQKTTWRMENADVDVLREAGTDQRQMPVLQGILDFSAASAGESSTGKSDL